MTHIGCFKHELKLSDTVFKQNVRKRKFDDNWGLKPISIEEQTLKSIIEAEITNLPLKWPVLNFLARENQEENIESDSEILSILRSEKILKPKFPSKYKLYAAQNYIIYLRNIYSQREYKLKLFIKSLKSKVKQCHLCESNISYQSL